MLEYAEYAPTGIVWEKSMPAHWKSDKAKRFFMSPKVINKGNVEKNVMSLTLRGVIRNDFVFRYHLSVFSPLPFPFV